MKSRCVRRLRALLQAEGADEVTLLTEVKPKGLAHTSMYSRAAFRLLQQAEPAPEHAHRELRRSSISLTL